MKGRSCCLKDTNWNKNKKTTKEESLLRVQLESVNWSTRV